MQVLHEYSFFGFFIKWTYGQYACLYDLHGSNSINNFELWRDI